MINSENDPFASVRLNSKKETSNQGLTSEPKSSQKEFQEKQQKDPFYNVRISSPKEFETGDDLDREVERNIGGLVSRGIEQIAGFPGNIRDFAYGIKDLYHNDAILGKIKSLTKEPESFKKFQDEQMPLIGAVSSMIDWFPTSSELREKSENLTKGFTKPTDEYSKMGHEIFENIISSTMPGAGHRNIYRNVAVPILGVLSKKGAEYLGIGEKGQAATQFGTTFLLNMMNRSNAPRLNQDMWNNVQNTTPNVNLRPNENTRLLQEARSLENQLLLGLGSNSENNALKAVRAFIEKLDRPQGTISARELVSSNRSLNEIAGDPALLQRGRTLLNGLRTTINRGIEYVGRRDPQWVQNWRNANETHGAIENSNFVANYVNRNYTKPLVSEGARVLFGAGAFPTAVAATAAAPIFGIYKGIQVLNRMSRSPILRRHYTNAILGTLRGNTAVMASNLEKLDKELAEKEKKIPYK